MLGYTSDQRRRLRRCAFPGLEVAGGRCSPNGARHPVRVPTRSSASTVSERMSVSQRKAVSWDYLRGVKHSDPPIQPTMPKPGLTALELAQDLVARIEQGNIHARSRKNRFRSSSSAVRMTSLILTVASTIILGLQQLNVWTGVAFR
jgi:hypothetical protein